MPRAAGKHGQAGLRALQFEHGCGHGEALGIRQVPRQQAGPGQAGGLAAAGRHVEAMPGQQMLRYFACNWPSI